MRYLVVSPGGRTLEIEAINGTQAKRKACRYWNIKPSDPWCGMSGMKAIKIEPERSVRT